MRCRAPDLIVVLVYRSLSPRPNPKQLSPNVFFMKLSSYRSCPRRHCRQRYRHPWSPLYSCLEPTFERDLEVLPSRVWGCCTSTRRKSSLTRATSSVRALQRGQTPGGAIKLQSSIIKLNLRHTRLTGSDRAVER